MNWLWAARFWKAHFLIVWSAPDDAEEAAGLAIKVPADAARGFVLRWGVEKTPVLRRVVGLGSKMVMVGGAISALAGIADAGASFRAAARVSKAGDVGARRAHIFAGALSIFGAAMISFDVPPEYPYRSKLEVWLLLSAPNGARRSHETVEIYRRA
ncbi:hypothetical protein ABE599_21090, partial [Achromobacter mucicolens]|uniref:hypothetical protein n=1 Tax=Achromobacter mucicolens TaxID=1389922 RepID=UPI003208FDB1